jgi:tripartite-type tricarboxylate transporter receptor subunit TctC
MKLIGVGTPARHPQFPEVPTISESGLPGFTFNSWFAIVAPAGTPKDIIARLNAEAVKALADPDVREKLALQGLTPRGSSPEELRKTTADQLARYGRLFRQAGISAD